MENKIQLHPFLLFYEADIFGKFLYLSLLFLSIYTWVCIVKKYKILKAANKQFISHRTFESLIQNNLALPKVGINPEMRLYATARLAAKNLLEKNAHFSKNSDFSPLLSKTDIEFVEGTIEMQLTKEIEPLYSGLYTFRLAASIAPYLGILGTVWGLVLSLTSMSSQASSSEIISGLSTALITTILGLVIAIPAIIAHSIFVNKAEQISRTYSASGDKILSLLTFSYMKGSQ